MHAEGDFVSDFGGSAISLPHFNWIGALFCPGGQCLFFDYPEDSRGDDIY
jgi:hypothetical protein